MHALFEMDIDARLERLLAQVGGRDRVAIEKHLGVCESEGHGHAVLFRRLLVRLGELAPLPVRAAGGHAMQFFVADGKYRMQVFALDDSVKGSVSVYLPNVMAKAVEENLLVKNGENYSPAGDPERILIIQKMDVKSPLDPPEYMKHMLGWNREAIRLTLHSGDPDPAEVYLAEALCTLAARRWANAVAGV